MTRPTANSQRSTLPLVRCAIYTRKSTEEGLEQAFNTLDAQRESGEAFIKSQAHDGWTCLPEKYNDGGWSGATMDRPALQRLLADINAGKIDCVIVYKVDRLSRSLLDFARLMQVFDDHKVAFVSVTQSFNSATSMGRLVLNVLLSFAQFEREIISERTRDKIAATRRKGKWTGGMPLLGYDIDSGSSKLLVNEPEAVRVRAIFQSYLEHEALLPVVRELESRGWNAKRWQTRVGHERGGRPFDRTSLYRLLTNVAYIGQVKHKGSIYPGEHTGIVPQDLWDQVQAVLRRNGRTAGASVRSAFTAILTGILRCSACDSAMSPSQTTKQKTKHYRYYVCSSAQKRGWNTCPSKSIPAAQIEKVIVDQLRAVATDPAILAATLAEARRQVDAQRDELDAERRGLDREMAKLHAEVRKLALKANVANDGDPELARLAEVNERIRLADGRLARVRDQMATLRREAFDADEVAEALGQFMPVWEALTPNEQARAIRLLIQRVDYDGGTGKIKITFHPTGLRTLAERTSRPQEKIA